MNAPSLKLESAACPLGCPPGHAPVLKGVDRLHGLPGEFQVVRCATCGLLRTEPRPTPDTIGQYYPEDYGPYVGTQIRAGGGAPAGGLKRLLLTMFHRLVRSNEQAIPPLDPGRMLEVGRASGAYLATMAAAGWQVEGIEFSGAAAQRARAGGFKVQTGSLEDASGTEASFDLIAGWMVIEHLHDPVTALRKLAHWARPGAWLCISVPNAAALEFRVFRGAWYALQLPTHLYHFSPATIAGLLGRAGWKIERVFHQRNLSNLVASLGYWLEDRGGPARVCRALQQFPDRAGRWSYVLYPLAWFMSLFGQTGRMTIWARKAQA